MDNICITNPSQTLNDKILTYEAIIIYQKQEILKTEALVSEFQNCLISQNKALQMFCNEKARLIAERDAKSITNGQSPGILNNANNANHKISKKVATRGMRRKGSTVVESPLSSKRSIHENDEVKKSFPTQINDNSEAMSQPMKIYLTDNAMIHKILCYDNDVFIGGSRGLLVRYTESGFDTYQTNTSSIIEQLEILQNNQRKSLIAFTKSKIIIFEDLDNLSTCRDIMLSTVGYVYNDVSAIYVPIKDGEIQKLISGDLGMVHFASLRNGDVRNYVPGFENSKFCLLTFKDSLLYKATKTNTRIQNVEIIDGVTEVKRIMRVGLKNYLFYTDDTVTLMNSSLQIVETLPVPAGIKHVAVSSMSCVTVDRNNVVTVYAVNEQGHLGGNYWRQTVAAGTVTALALTDKHVYFAIGHEFFVFQYNL